MSFFSVPGLFSLYPGYSTTKGSKAPEDLCSTRLQLSGKSRENRCKQDCKYTYPLRTGERKNLAGRKTSNSAN